jgi:hypothetical protein
MLDVPRWIALVYEGRGLMTEHTLLRDAFALTLRLDEATGDFVCRCTPPLNDVITADVQRASTHWLKQIARGWACRRNDGSRVDRKDVHVDFNGGFKRGSIMRGTFVAPEMTAQDLATASTRRELMRKLKRGEKLVGNEVTLAVGFGLGEAYRSDKGEICFKPHNYRTPCFGTIRGLSRKPTAASP